MNQTDPRCVVCDNHQQQFLLTTVIEFEIYYTKAIIQRTGDTLLVDTLPDAQTL